MTTFQLMHDHVRAIYRAVTGRDLPEADSTVSPTTETSASVGQVEQGFAELDTLARRIPVVADRVPPFSFAPPLDAYRTDRELIVELGVPGVDRDDVRVSLSKDTLVIEGSRSTEGLVNGRSYFHAEIPRGPFRRVAQLPHTIVGEPRVEVDRGVIRIRLSRAATGSAAKA